MADRTVKVRLEAVTAGFQKGMASAAKSMDGIEEKMESNSKAAERWQRVGQASTVAGAAIAGGLLYAANAAKNTETAMLAMGAVFGSQTDQMKQYAAGAAEVGLSQQEYAESATLLGAQLKNLGADEDVLATKTNELTLMAADMAAQFGGPTSQATAALSALMRGERDPIERYGIGIKEVGIQAEMAATGGTKLEATMSLLNKQFENSGAAGAAIRNADTLSQQLNIMKAHIDNAAAELGAVLLPALAKTAETVGSVAKAFSSLPGPIKTAVAVLGALGAAVLLLGPRLVAMAPAFKAMGTAAQGAVARMSGASVSMRAIGIAAGAVTAGLTAVVTGLAIYNMKMQETEGNAERLAAIMTNSGNAMRDVNADIRMMLSDSVSADDWQAMANELGMSVDQIVASIQAGGTDEAEAIVVAEFKDQAPRTRPATSSSVMRRGGPLVMNSVSGAADAVNGSLKMTEDTMNSTSEAGRVSALTFDDIADSVNKATDAINGFINLNLNASAAQDALIGNSKELTAAITENGGAITANNAKGAATRDVIRAQITEHQKLADSLRDQALENGEAGDASKVWASTVQDGANQVAEDLRKAGVPIKEVRQLMEEMYSSVPGDMEIVVKENGSVAVKNKIDGVNDAAASLPDEENIDITTTGTSAAVSEFAGVETAAGDIPEETLTAVRTSNAESAIQDFRNASIAANAIPSEVITRITTIQSTKGPAKGEATAQATGGYISGPGTATSDSIPAMLSNGEYVIRASAVDRIGLGALNAINSGRVSKFANGGYAGGGKMTSGDYWDTIRRQRQQEEARQRAVIAAQEAAERARKQAFEDSERARERAERAAHKAREDAAERAHKQKVKQFEKERRQARKRLQAEADRAANVQRFIENKRKKGGSGKAKYQDKYGNFYRGRLKGDDKNKYKKAQKTINALAAFDQATSRRVGQMGNYERRDFSFQSKGYQAGFVGSYKTPDYYDHDKATQKKIDRLDDAFGAYKKLADEKIAFMEGVSDNFQNKFKSLGLLDPSNFKAASEALKAGATALSKANRELVGKTGSDRRNALEDMMVARAKQAEAAIEASKKEVTLSNIMGNAEEQNKIGHDFMTNMEALRKRGLNSNMLDEIMSMGGEQGNAIMSELLGASAAQIARLNAIDGAQGWRGGVVGAGLGSRFDTGIRGAANELRVAISASPVTLKVDGKTLATALIDYKRKTGINF